MRPLTAHAELEIRFELSTRSPGQASTAGPRVGARQLAVAERPHAGTGGRATSGSSPSRSTNLRRPPATAIARLVPLDRRAAARCCERRRSTARDCTTRSCVPTWWCVRSRCSAVADHPTRNRYTAVIANRGRQRARDRSRSSSHPGAPARAARRSRRTRIGPRRHRTVRFTGPACDAADPPDVVVDPSRTVDDSQRSDNALTRPGLSGTS